MKTTAEKIYFDYRDVKLIQRYLDSYGKIEPRVKTGLTAKQQKQLSAAIKRARHLGLISFTGRN